MDRLTPINILYAEDNLGDIRLTQEALKEDKLSIKLHIVMDGVEAMDFLRKKGKYANVPTPDLILLDLNMPRKDGRQVLREVKEDPALKTIPVVVLTISKSEVDILQSYNLHVNCYIVKPPDLNKFIEISKTFKEFWFSIVKLPPKID